MRGAAEGGGLRLLLRGHLADRVPLGGVAELVAEDAGQLVLGGGGADEAGVHVEVAAGNGKGVDAGVVDHV